MKNKLIYSNYDRETGISFIKIRNKYGTFEARAKLCEEDRDIESRFLGCEIALCKAEIKTFKTVLKDLDIQIHTLRNFEKTLKSLKEYNKDSLENRRLRRRIHELEAEKADIKCKIILIEDYCKNATNNRREFLKKINHGENC